MNYFLLLIFALFSIGCSKKHQTVEKIGIDSAFQSMALMGKEPNVLAYCTDILAELRHENFNLEKVMLTWDDLLEALDEKKVNAILSSMYPYVFNQKRYLFSEPFLLTGPVIVTSTTEAIKDFSDLKDKEVVVLDMATEQLLLQVAPDSIPRIGTSLSQVLADLADGRFDAAFIDVIPAASYVRDLYSSQLHIVTKPYGDAGLRCIALRSDGQSLIQRFDKALAHLEKSGKLAELRSKWALSSSM